MTSRLTAAFISCLLLAGCGNALVAPSERTRREFVASPVAAVSPPSSSDVPKPRATSGVWPARPQGTTESATLVRVVDGDTIRAALGGVEHRIRYIGIDTPESVDPGTPVEAFSLEAADLNRQLLQGGDLVLEIDVSEVDRYGRLLRYVWVRNPSGECTFVNLELVLAGYAQVATHPPDVRYVDVYLAAQRDAREAGRGSWAR